MRLEETIRSGTTVVVNKGPHSYVPRGRSGPARGAPDLLLWEWCLATKFWTGGTRAPVAIGAIIAMLTTAERKVRSR